jgi:hepatocyte growth factor-regulated tyrosine kinase substrate
MNILKTEGFKFPDIKDLSDKLFASDVAPEWADGDVCHRCRTAFSLVNRKHHCKLIYFFLQKWKVFFFKFFF